jgi:hypothetical protein
MMNASQAHVNVATPGATASSIGRFTERLLGV